MGNDLLSRCRDVLIRADCPTVAKLLPLENAYLQHHELGFVIANVELKSDKSCPHGIFEISTAIDISEEKALVRAVFESVERYCLGSIGRHDHRIQETNLDDPNLIVFRKGVSAGFTYAERVRVVNTDKGLMAAIGDVFAPYPHRDGNIGAPSTTNGCSCHTTEWDAKLGAALELFERHCIMNFWFYERTSARPFPMRIADTGTRQIIGILAELGYQVYVFEVSTRIDVSVALGFAIHKEQIYPYCICSASAKLAQTEALSGCLYEMLQTLVALSFSEIQAKEWLSSGAKLTRLHHNMFYYAFPELGSFIHQALDCIPPVVTDTTHIASDGVSFLNSLFGDGTSGDLISLTPPEFSEEVFAFRAISDELLKLVVGDHFGESRLLTSNSRLQAPHPFP